MHKEVVIAVEFNGSVIYPVLLSGDGEVVLIDCGYPGCLPLIKAAAAENGIDIAGLTKIIITHHDFDHMGALAEFKREYPSLKVMASQAEAKYISGQARSLRLLQAEALDDKLPESEKANARRFRQMLEAVEPVAVDIDLRDKEMFPWCGGVEIVATPGHMPGHISLYLRESKTLVAGDAMTTGKGRLAMANPQYTLDLAEAKRSVEKLLNYEIDTIICYHGGVYKGGVRSALEALIKNATA